MYVEVCTNNWCVDSCKYFFFLIYMLAQASEQVICTACKGSSGEIKCYLLELFDELFRLSLFRSVPNIYKRPIETIDGVVTWDWYRMCCVSLLDCFFLRSFAKIIVVLWTSLSIALKMHMK
jgi:hypothetical protein